MEQHEEFQFTYSAVQQSEVQRIRSKYLPQQESGLDRLRRLDRIPGRKARTRALILGILGTLVLGTGMSLSLTDLGAYFGLGALSLPLGIGVGILGMIGMALAYPVYRRVLEKERQKIAPEILRLSQDLL